MISKTDVIDFFDRCAASWDAEMIKDSDIVNSILDNAGICAGQKILDVACGTGVLINDYLDRDVKKVIAVDISSEMIRRAKAKFSDNAVEFICGDVESCDVGSDFDAIVVYNAFPHFPEPEKLIAHLADLLHSGGKLTVAHGMSREKIDAHHHGVARGVSEGLMYAEDLASLFKKYLKVTVLISDDRMYQVVGEKL